MSAFSTVSEPKKPGPVLVEMIKAAPKPKKKLIRRLLPDNSQRIRHAVQFAFILLNAFIGMQFYKFVRFYETGSVGQNVTRPAGVEGYLPIAGLMNLKAALLTGSIPKIHPAGMFLIVSFLMISFVFRKTFCSWLCPVGTFSEYLWKFGRKFLKGNLKVPRWLDIGLRGLKYLLLAFFLYAVISMTPRDIHAFLQSPYGALMGLASLLSPLKITRNTDTCIDCAKCAKACPSHLQVDQLITIKSAECTACMECVAVCPAEKALVFAAPRRKVVPAWAVAAGIAAIFLGTVSYAKLTHRWNTEIPSQVYQYLVVHADEATHPMPGSE